MPEAPTTEPWAGTPPVPHALRPGARPEAYMAKIAEGDERLWVPIGRPQVEDVYSKPVWISPTLKTPAPGNNGEDIHNYNWTYSAYGRYGIAVVAGKGFVISMPTS